MDGFLEKISEGYSDSKWNWEIVKDKYPKVKKILVDEYACCHTYSFQSMFEMREFYDFFDSHGLYVNISQDFYKSGLNWLYQIFWYDTERDDEKELYDKPLYSGTGQYGDNNEYPSRREAEEAAFEHAMFILECGIEEYVKDRQTYSGLTNNEEKRIKMRIRNE